MRNRSFEKIFYNDGIYPYVRLIKAERDGAPDVILFVFDSTQILRLYERISIDTIQKRIAHGEMTETECNWLLRECVSIGQSATVNGQPVNLANCVRIAALHHHPLESPERGKLANLKGMYNSKLFVEACLKSGMNLVLFGHQHKAYAATIRSQHGNTPFGPPGPVHFLCCPTTFEYTCRKPGFYLHELYSNRGRVRHYYWEGAGFSEEPEVLPLSFTYPGGQVAQGNDPGARTQLSR
jgi:hypothetical protein